MNSTHVALYDPEGHLNGELPLDRATHERMVKAVLGWPADPGLRPADLEQIALQLKGAAHAVADDIRHAAAQLTDGHTAHTLAEAQHHLTPAPQGTVRCAQSHAHLLRTLYEHLDHLTEPTPKNL
ncbi:restriction endonuclease [Streptomyces goshikiensis]|uniref:restriction endonuclease n=1 Tax=Streptomyces goshikiensis TaxID=1942 RepID=UPI00364965FB